MSDEQRPDAADKARELREHEAEARERDSNERDQDTGDKATDERPGETVIPPANAQAGNLTGS